MITREQFVQYAGREPELDDMERVNCLSSGSAGHLSCGWDYYEMKPRFMTKPLPWNGTFPRSTETPAI